MALRGTACPPAAACPAAPAALACLALGLGPFCCAGWAGALGGSSSCAGLRGFTSSAASMLPAARDMGQAEAGSWQPKSCEWHGVRVGAAGAAQQLWPTNFHRSPPCHVHAMPMPCPRHAHAMSTPCPCHAGHAMPCHAMPAMPCPSPCLVPGVPCHADHHEMPASPTSPCHAMPMPSVQTLRPISSQFLHAAPEQPACGHAGVCLMWPLRQNTWSGWLRAHIYKRQRDRTTSTGSDCRGRHVLLSFGRHVAG